MALTILLKITGLMWLAIASMNCEMVDEAPTMYEKSDVYLYKYKAQILTGLPTASYQYTGLNLEALIHIQFKEYELVNLMMQQINISRINRPITVAEPSVFVPMELFESLKEQQLETLFRDNLKKPIQFVWHMGVVSKLRVLKDDPFWSVNMKKGLLTMFNVDMMPYRHYTPLNPESRGDFYEGPYEEGVEGLCRSVYNWNKFPFAVKGQERYRRPYKPDIPHDNVLVVMTKTRSMYDCLQTPNFEYASMFAADCDQKRYNVTRDIVKAESTTRVNATFWRSNRVFFWSSLTTSRYTFAPVNAKFGSISSFVRQYLNFIHRVPVSSELQSNFHLLSNFYNEEESLMMKVPMEEMELNKVDSKTNLDLAHNLLNSISEELEKLKRDSVGDQLAVLVRRFVRVLSQLTETALLDIHQICSGKRAKQPELFKLYQDILPSVATTDALAVVMKTSVLDNRSSVFEEDSDVARRISGFGLVNNVYFPQMVDMLIVMARNPVLTQNPKRRETLKAMWMTIGTLTNTYLTDSRRTTGVDVDNKLAKNVLNFYYTLLKAKPDEIPILTGEEKTITLIKAMGNSGIREGMQYLEQIINDRKQSVTVRVQTVYALKNMALRFATEVQHNLVPILFDISRDAELRIASYLLIIETRPDVTLLYSIAAFIRREPVEEVKHFILTHLNEFIKEPCKCDSYFKKNVSRVLETIDETISPSFKRSRMNSYSIYQKAMTLETGIIWTPKQFLPRSMNAKVLLQPSDKKTELLEFGIRTEGLQQLLTNLLGPNGTLWNVNNIMEIVEKYQPSTTSTDSRFAVYMKIFGDEFGFWALDEQLKDLLLKGSIGLTNRWFDIITGKATLPIQYQRTIFMDGIKRIPTTFGIPFTTNVTGLIYTNVNGELTPAKDAVRSLNLNASIISQIVMESGIDAAILKSYAKLCLDASIPQLKNVKINIQWENDGKIRCHMRDPIDRLHLIHINATQRTIFEELNLMKNEMNIETKVVALFHEISHTAQHRDRSVKTVEEEWPLLKWHVKQEFIHPMKIFTRAEPSPLLHGNMFYNLFIESAVKIPANENFGTELRFQMNPKWKLELLKMKFKPRSTGGQEKPFVEVTVVSKSGGTSQSVLNFDSASAVITVRLLDAVNQKMTNYINEFSITPPEKVPFDPHNPMKVNFDVQKRHTFQEIAYRLKSENAELLFEYMLTIDMDDERLELVKEMIKNPSALQAVDKMFSECVKNMKDSNSNSGACFLTWKYLNEFNRYNVTMTANKEKLPSQLFQWLKRYVEDTISGLSPKLTSIQLNSNRKLSESIVQNKKVTTVSPYDRQLAHMEMSANGAILQFQRLLTSETGLLPQLWNFIHDEILHNDVSNICMIRRNPHSNSGTVMTFDGVSYAMPRVIPTQQEVKSLGRVVLAQDLKEHFQLSAVLVNDMPVIQILTKFKHIKRIQLMKTKKLSSIEVLVNGEAVKLPYEVGKNILKISRVNSNDEGMKELVEVESRILGVKIRTDVYTMVDTTISRFYHNSMRGACGDFDGEKLMEMKTPDCKKFFYVPGDVYRCCEYNTVKEVAAKTVKEALQDSTITSFLKLSPCLPMQKLLPIRGECSFFERIENK